jgi:hypothetical protein
MVKLRDLLQPLKIGRESMSSLMLKEIEKSQILHRIDRLNEQFHERE